MTRWLGKYSPYFYALMRIVVGLSYAMHGAQKLFGWPGNRPRMEMVSLMGIAGVIELVGGLMVALGLLASVAAFIASGEMAVAYFKQHAPGGMFPILNGGELAVLYCFVMLYIASYGSGVLSLDSLRRGGKR